MKYLLHVYFIYTEYAVLIIIGCLLLTVGFEFALIWLLSSGFLFTWMRLLDILEGLKDG